MASPVPTELLRKYLAYARQHCRPTLSAPAKRALKAFYLELRQQAAASPGLCVNVRGRFGAGAFKLVCAVGRERWSAPAAPVLRLALPTFAHPLTALASAPAASHPDPFILQARHLESAIRLTEARARVDLRCEATEGDAADVVELLRHSMRDFVTQRDGVMSRAAAPKGARGGEQRLLTALQELAQGDRGRLFTVAELRSLADTAGVSGSVHYAIERLNDAGQLLRKGGDTYAVA